MSTLIWWFTSWHWGFLKFKQSIVFKCGFVAGGETSNFETTHSPVVDSFDNVSWSTTRIANMPPPNVVYFCSVKINSTLIMTIGGYITTPGYVAVPNTTFYNSLENRWYPGPSLKSGRTEHTCAILNWKNPSSGQTERYVVVVGGIVGSTFLHTVELLYLNEPFLNSTWVNGPQFLPLQMSGTLTEYNNSVVLAGGLSDNSDPTPKMFQLSSPNGPWVEMKQRLKQARFLQTSFLVPDELVTCR